MININFIAVGKLKESWYKAACEEYAKRLGAYAKIEIREPEPAFLPQDPKPAQIEAALGQEAKKIREAIKSGAKIALCVEGKQLSSEELAKKIESLSVSGTSTINFLVGSSFGLAESLKNECDFKLSMSPMTFPHSLARVMLFEQVYRAFSIIGGAKYHK